MRKKVVSIITLPVRLLRRLLGLFGLLARLFRKRDKQPKKNTTASPAVVAGASEPVVAPGKRPRRNPLKRLRGLKGRPRIAAFVILGVVVIVAVLSLRPGPNAEKDVRATLVRYAAATRAKDYQALCDELFSKDIVSGLRSVGLPCEVALRGSTLSTVRNPTLTVLGVEVSGDQALARARSTATGEPTSIDTIKLVREDGGWRIASLAEPGTQTEPQPQPATP